MLARAFVIPLPSSAPMASQATVSAYISTVWLPSMRRGQTRPRDPIRPRVARDLAAALVPRTELEYDQLRRGEQTHGCAARPEPGRDVEMAAALDHVAAHEALPVARRDDSAAQHGEGDLAAVGVPGDRER